MSTQVAFVLGTRPEIIKLAPVIRACRERGVEHVILHTGQHYSETLDSVFFEQLELPEPDRHLGVGSGSHGEQTGRMLIRVEQALEELDPGTVLVQGDTNSVLAGAIAASKMDVELGHVEAGLRSFDRAMPEETNRVVADHVADHCFAPTEGSRRHLETEGVPPSRIVVTGNTVVDALERNRALARRKSSVLAELDLEESEFFLMTAHRAENVDDESRFRGLLEGVDLAARDAGVEVVYPVHPRASVRLSGFGIDVPDRIRTIEPADYLDFLRLESAAEVILTDSGGVQEEACVLGVPCVTMRDSTERPETTAIDANRLCGTAPAAIRRAAAEARGTAGDWENPFGDGTAGERIVEHLLADPEAVSP